jgi:hypothetical protein
MPGLPGQSLNHRGGKVVTGVVLTGSLGMSAYAQDGSAWSLSSAGILRIREAVTAFSRTRGRIVALERAVFGRHFTGVVHFRED